MELTLLQSHVVREIVASARRDNLQAGDHLAESLLAEKLGTSRSPVNVALRHLTSLGVLTHDLNRGYFMSRHAADIGDVARQFSAPSDDPLYLAIASDRLAQKLPDEVNEIGLMRRYQVTRAAVRKVLLRVQQEGWIEKAVGHGWRFVAMIDSPQAYEESYVYRAAIEPTGLLSAGFRADSAELAALRRQQAYIAEEGFNTMTSAELVEANSHFHETLAKWSGNRFVLQGVRRTDQLRRLVEYRHAARERSPRRTQAQEHLAILDAIAANDQLIAASLMRAHLEGARKSKVYGGGVFSSK